MAVPWYIIKFYVQKHSKFASSLLCLLLMTIVLYRYVLLMLVVWSFMLGMAVSYTYLSTDFLLPNLLFMYKRKKKKGAESVDELTLMKTFCTVCGQRRCPRHRPELNILAFQPWTNLEMPQSVDKALEEFLTIVLNEFVYTWYRNLSMDEEFVDELRTTIRFFLSVVLRRAKKIDVPTLVTEKIIQAAIRHLHVCLKAREQVSSGADLQQLTLQELGSSLHSAMQSRKSELEYIRRLVEKIFPYILRPQALQSKAMCALLREMMAGSIIMPAMDAIANPDMVNNMILIFLDETPPPPPPAVASPSVPFLASFSNQRYDLSDPEQPIPVSKSSLRFVLGDVMDPENPKMLYPFMQFLKSEAAVNVLQFALSCEDFNKRILNPDLSDDEIVQLHADLKDLYRIYLAPSAPDRINFEDSVVYELMEIVEGQPESVTKLCTSTPMFRAYEHVYNLLSYTFLPLFHQSEDYYTMICGERLASQVANKNQSSSLYLSSSQNYFTRQVKKKEFGIGTIGSKLKEVFKSSDTRSSQDFLNADNFEEADTTTIASTGSLEDDAPSIDALVETIEHLRPHDLSTWRVTIPKIGARPDPDNFRKMIYVFILDVRRVDMSNDGRSMWEAARKYGEFYLLEQKLKEFHGEFTECQLPPKKLMGTNNQDFIEGKREIFEQYIQKLLTKPHLKGSQLLYNFLTEDVFDTGFDINIGRVLKSVPRKLIKEKGQHLESFLQNLEKSTEAPKPTPSQKRERRDSGASRLSSASEISMQLSNSIYENNADGILRSTEEVSEVTERSEVTGVYDVIVYLARHVFHVPDWVHHVLCTARLLTKMTFETFLDWYINERVSQVTLEHRLVGFINLLRDVLFFDKDPPRTDDQKRERYDETISQCLQFLPELLVKAMGGTNHEEGVQFVLHCLQQPKLNKQLSYVFLDVLITEMFPELLHQTS